MARRDVQPGQTYQKLDTATLWEVTSITKDGEGIPHARLAKVGDPASTKLISVPALKDARLYKLVESS